MQLKYNMRAASTEVLGFGHRCVFWTQGCSRVPPCPGCIGQDARDPAGGIACSVEEMADWILSIPSAAGLTVSGGEPFDQAAAVAEVIRLVRRHKGPDFSVIVYTGHTAEHLTALARTDEQVQALLSETDILIDGAYVAELDDNLPYRGSSNQRILIRSERFRLQAEAYYRKEPGRPVEYLLQRDQTMLIGVPSKTMAERWRAMKSSVLAPAPDSDTAKRKEISS